MRRFIVMALLGTCVSGQALAWGQTGHRVTGAIAEHYLSSEAKSAIEKLIGNESLAQASTYPDEQRSNPSTFWRKTASPWHYVTVPKGEEYGHQHAPKQGDAMTALKQFSETLRDPEASKEDKQLALRFVVHIVGDLHQPLHAGNGTDRGGNDVKLEFFWEDSNLHRVWDSGMIDKQQLSYTEWTNWLTKAISKEEFNAWQETNPNVWIKESTELRDQIYPKKPSGDDEIKINWQYAYDHTPQVKLRLSQAGVRLAAYLNDLFAAPK